MMIDIVHGGLASVASLKGYLVDLARRLTQHFGAFTVWAPARRHKQARRRRQHDFCYDSAESDRVLRMDQNQLIAAAAWINSNHYDLSRFQPVIRFGA